MNVKIIVLYYSSEALSAQSVLESVEDIASADETPVSEMAQKVLNNWSSLREAYKIPRKERIQQMKKHEQEAGKYYAFASTGVEF